MITRSIFSFREDNIEETTSSSNVGEETTENWRKRGFVRRKRIKKPKSTIDAQGEVVVQHM